MKLIRSLKLFDIVLLNVTAIIGFRWIALAAAGGNTSMVLWIAALLLFFIPLAFAVIELTSRLPGEGGVYLWTKKAFGEFHGFMSGWCYWSSNLIYFPHTLIFWAGISVFVIGDGFQAIGDNKSYVLLFSLLILGIMILFNFIGLKIGKWVNNIGGIGLWLAATILIIFGVVAIIKFGVANPMPIESFFTNIFSLDKLRVFAYLCFGFAGLELASVLAEEIKNPRKVIPKATIYSGVIITIVYLLGTFSILVTLPASEINIISGFMQGISAIATKLGLERASQFIALFITLGGIGGLMAWFMGAARMPFVAGVDKYLPYQFGKIHPKFGTPYIAIFVQGAIAIGFLFMGFVGSTVKDAYLVLLDTSLLVYFVPYLYMFSAYIVIRNKNIKENDNNISILQNRMIAKIVGLVGLLTTLFAMILNLVPSPSTSNIMLHEIKVIGGFSVFILVGAGIYWWGKNQKFKTKILIPK